MNVKVKLNDKRVVEFDDLGKLPDGTLVDISPMKKKGDVPRKLDEGGQWQRLKGVPADGIVVIQPLDKEDIQKLIVTHAVKEVKSGP